VSIFHGDNVIQEKEMLSIKYFTNFNMIKNLNMLSLDVMPNLYHSSPEIKEVRGI